MYNVYDEYGYIVAVNIPLEKVSLAVGCRRDEAIERVKDLPQGCKRKLHQYLVERIREDLGPYENVELKKVIITEWDKACEPFRRLRRHD